MVRKGKGWSQVTVQIWLGCAGEEWLAVGPY